MMKSLLASILVATLPGLADAQDWSGAYGGLGYSSISGHEEEFVSGVSTGTWDSEGNLASLMLGFNMQSGNFVYGGELGYSRGKITFQYLDPNNNLDGMLDLKARFGFATGKALWYGTIGYVRTERNFSGAVTNDPITTSGHSFGLGVDIMVSDRVFVGLEALQRNLANDAGEVGGFPTTSYDYAIRSLNLRVGLRF